MFNAEQLSKYFDFYKDLDNHTLKQQEFNLNISAKRYIELALLNPAKTAEYIVTAIRMQKQSRVCKTLQC